MNPPPSLTALRTNPLPRAMRPDGVRLSDHRPREPDDDAREHAPHARMPRPRDDFGHRPTRARAHTSARERRPTDHGSAGMPGSPAESRGPGANLSPIASPRRRRERV